MESLVFRNSEFGELDVILIKGKEYFPANQCASILGYAVPKDAISRHCKGALKHRLPTNGGMQDIKYIPEGDLYRLIIASKLPKAEQFEHWVFDEVLPSIRKTGIYSLTTKPDSYTIDDPVTRAERWIEEYKERKALEVRLEEQKPLVDFAEQVSDTSDVIDIGVLSKLLKRKGLDIGRNKLFEWLRKNKYLMDNNVPYQRYINAGYFKTKEYTFFDNEDEPHIKVQTYVTGKGQQYIFNKLSSVRM